MTGVDPRLVFALRAQLERRRQVLAAGAGHVGWKLGVGERERIGGSIAVGYLTSGSVLTVDSYRAEVGADLNADAEAVVEFGADVAPSSDESSIRSAVARYGAALELVDLAPLDGGPDAVVATNIFHRAVAFATAFVTATENLEVAVAVDGEPRARGRWPDDLFDRLRQAVEVLDAVGERFRAGDRVITGSIVQIPVDSGDDVTATFGDQAAVRLFIE